MADPHLLHQLHESGATVPLSATEVDSAANFNDNTWSRIFRDQHFLHHFNILVSALYLLKVIFL